MKTKNNGERLVPGQKDTYRRSEMEFGVAADAYRSDPTKRATRNGAVMITIALAIVAFALMLGASVVLASGLTLTGILLSAVVGLAVLSSVHVCMDWERAVVMRLVDLIGLRARVCFSPSHCLNSARCALISA